MKLTRRVAKETIVASVQCINATAADLAQHGRDVSGPDGDRARARFASVVVRQGRLDFESIDDGLQGAGQLLHLGDEVDGELVHVVVREPVGRAQMNEALGIEVGRVMVQVVDERVDVGKTGRPAVDAAPRRIFAHLVQCRAHALVRVPDDGKHKVLSAPPERGRRRPPPQVHLVDPVLPTLQLPRPHLPRRLEPQRHARPRRFRHVHKRDPTHVVDQHLAAPTTLIENPPPSPRKHRFHPHPIPPPIRPPAA